MVISRNIPHESLTLAGWRGCRVQAEDAQDMQIPILPSCTIWRTFLKLGSKRPIESDLAFHTCLFHCFNGISMVARFCEMGFSQKMCLPAFAASIISWVVGVSRRAIGHCIDAFIVHDLLEIGIDISECSFSANRGLPEG
jgi:hypothetical protein